MSEIVIYVVAILASGLTLISGFGLGTLMLPVFALFFPVEIAVGMTAIVHVLNNFFKMGMLYKQVEWKVVLRFGLPGMVGAFLGARLLLQLDEGEPWYTNGAISILPLNATIGVLMIFFAFAELSSGFKKMHVSEKWLLPGGFISGFFGGLSGHQGALRSMFLVKANLDKKVYIATVVAIALAVDITRIPVYWSKYDVDFITENSRVITLATLFAFLGAYLGKKVIHKVTMATVHNIVGILLIALGALMFLGII
ncbi:MAG: sulfite exporter TauE/SafE family protein [Schleiferiaceae bacterium]|jgi:uncharacterized membrane protein YfcA|nr:sulfite exporter TauE/SafE family protein [Schleiferiaceae bacterium]